MGVPLGRNLYMGIMVDLHYTAWLALIVTILVVSLACTAEAPVNTPFTVEIASPELTLDLSNCSTVICCADCMAMDVDRIIDGDTFQSANARIRLFGVDTPERGEPCFTESTKRFKELAGGTVRVERGPREEDRYGRILFYVYTNEGESIDETLVQEGLALAWTRDGQHRDVLVSAEEEARRDERGCLW